MMGGGGGGGGGGDPQPPAPELPDLSDLLRLLELLTSIDGPGAYGLQGPCDLGEDGELLPPRVAEWGPSIGLKGLIVKRLDALAELIQHHKDLAQPTCPRRRPVGEIVSVNFEEVL